MSLKWKAGVQSPVCLVSSISKQPLSVAVTTVLETTSWKKGFLEESFKSSELKVLGSPGCLPLRYNQSRSHLYPRKR